MATDARAKKVWEGIINYIKGSDLPDEIKNNMLAGIRTAMRVEGDTLGKSESDDQKVWDGILIKTKK